MDKDIEEKGVLDHEGELYEEEEKMKRSSSGSSCKVEAESIMGEEVLALNNSTPTTRVCDICFKTFSNGKALGGHRRSHFQASKKHQQKKVKAPFSNYHSKTGDNSSYDRANCDYDGVDVDLDVDDDDPLVCDGKSICFLCKKEFPTKNALFGHMRSHPERTWRGLQPPPTHHSHKHFNSPSSSSSHHFDSLEKNDKEDHQEEGHDFVDKVVAPDEGHRDRGFVDLSQFTSPSWLKKDKRGRRCIGLYAAAETLAYIYAYAKNFSGEPSGAKKPKVEPIKSPQAPIKKGVRIGESSSGEKHVVKKIKFYLSGEMKMEERPNGGEDDSDKIMNRGKAVSESGVETVSTNVDGDEEGVNEAFHIMNVEESASRLQDHDERKRKKVDKGKNNEKLVLSKSKARDTENENESHQEKLGGYKCSTCGKTFSSFQGLGGHRSIHKEKNIVVSMDAPKHRSHAVAEENHSSSSSRKMDIEPSLNEEVLADHEASQSTATKALNFDLNEPYVMEQDED